MSETPRTDAVVHNVAELAMFARKLERELREVQAENVRIRAALAHSSVACVYCALPKEQWAACRSGFPGCARADDAMGCPELGAALELEEAKRCIKRLEEQMGVLELANRRLGQQEARMISE